MIRAAIPRLRCAIYTRVSTDAGLEQEFNLVLLRICGERFGSYPASLSN